MRHRLGNTPKCITCYSYREKEPNDGCLYDGWCTNKYYCSHGINGSKRSKPPEREAVMWMWSCRRWEDAEARLTYFEVLTRTPEEWRSDGEKEYISQLLNRWRN